jgi:hypothetical protein
MSTPVQYNGWNYFRLQNENQKKDGIQLKLAIKEMLGFTRKGSRRRKETMNLNV